MSKFWHGTPGGLAAPKAIHIGTYKAATEALEARIGTPLTGTWDGTREYGKTMLAGKKTLNERGICASGYRCRGPEEDHYTNGSATYSDGTPVPMDAVPTIIEVGILGPMTNNSYQPHDDFKANGYMSAALKRGHAKRGYYYKNIAEDTGSISAVVPSMAHLEIIEA